MKKFSVILLALLILALPCLTVSAAAPTAISNAEDLKKISQKGNYYLADDITLSGNFSPLKTFSGTLDGRGKKIEGLKISITAGSSATVYAGLFEKLDGGTVKNLTFKDVVVSISGGGTVYVGAVAGKIESGAVFNCRTGGKINVSSDSAQVYAGGIAGANAAEIYLCENYINITAESHRILAGGIVGENPRPDYVLEKCANFGQISASCIADTNFVGGIVGRTMGKTDNSVLDCANFGAASLSADINACVGGIAGAVTQGQIKNCFNRGTLSCVAKTEATLDPIAAQYNSSKCTFSNNYYLDSSVMDLSTANIKTAAAMESKNIGNKAFFSGFDFDNIWQMTSDGPALLGITCPLPLGAQQDGTVSTPTSSATSSEGQNTSETTSGQQTVSGNVSGETSSSTDKNDPILDAVIVPGRNTPPVWIFIVIAAVIAVGVGAFLYFYETKKRN